MNLDPSFHRLVLDCDPGIDDALALLVAVGSPALQLLAVTCVAGNRPVQTTTRNAGRLLALAGRHDVPVYAGCARPIADAQARCNLVHGPDGLGGVELPEGRAAEAEHAVPWLVRTLSSAPEGSITLVAIGPLTNLAMAEILRPGLLRRARALLVMGGAVTCPGNITPAAEFNFYADPLAAHVVLQSGAHVTLFGLDVTSQAVMGTAWIDSLRDLGSACGDAAYRMLKAYAAEDPLLHDACPIAYLLDPALFAGQPHALAVEWQAGPAEGRVRPAAPPAPGEAAALPNATVQLHADTAGLMALVRECLTRLSP